jgi:hypothetical protein
MKTIEINKGSFGIASLFSEESTKEVIIEQSDMNGNYLEELSITFNIGDIFTLKSPSQKIANVYVLHKIRVHNISEDIYECEFID